MKNLNTFLFCLLFFTSLSAQKAPIKWDKIDVADLDMKVYDADPDAEAVILTDYATLEFDFSTGDLFYLLERHVRIKILKKSAFERGNISIPFYAYEKSEKISGLKAQVILPNGKKQSVRKKDMFYEEINKYWSQRKFAFPSLEEGCIIEYKYTKKSDQLLYLEDWVFQSDIPTRLSEFRTNIPEWFEYVSFNQGKSPEIAKESINKRLAVPRQEVVTNRESLSGRGSYRTGGSVDATIVKTRYYMENIPALKPERFITTMEDYYAKLSLQLQYIKYPDSPFRDVTTNWTKVAKELDDSPSFGDQINKKRNTKKIMAAIAPKLATAKSDEEKIAIIYSFISQNVDWNQLYSTRSSSLNDAFEKKSATSGELNLMLIALCRQSGIQAYPILISTRSHGKMMQYYPKTDQFNHVIALVVAGESEALLDVGSPRRDPQLLRLNSLNYMGWLVDKENSQWVKIPMPSDTEVLMANLKMDETGNITGDISQSFKGYCAMDARVEFHQNKEKDHEHIREEWQNVFPDIKINTINFENETKPTETLKCKLEIEVPEAAQVNGDFIYFSPLMGQEMSQNPLKQKERTFPVDMPIKFKDQYILNLIVPEGYFIEELPEAINMSIENSGARFQYLVSQNGNKVQVISKIIIDKVKYEPEEYATIKNFFDIIVEKQGEQIVLKKAG